MAAIVPQCRGGFLGVKRHGYLFEDAHLYYKESSSGDRMRMVKSEFLKEKSSLRIAEILFIRGGGVIVYGKHC